VSARQELLGILFDMDGVLYAADEIIGGAVKTVAWVCAQGISYLFLTNTTSISRAAAVDKLLAFGIPAQEAEIFTPTAAAAKWLRTQAAADIALFVRPAGASGICTSPMPSR
jgi:ribonucleotide monophosphatase NagD (HAD superfamily)